MKISCQSAFSLIELLVALSVLALVAAIIVPRFLGIRQSAQDAVAQQMASELNRTFATWQDSGGTIGSNAMTSDLLSLLSGSGDIGSVHPVSFPANATDPTTVVSDNTFQAAAIRVNLPSGTTITPNSSVVTLGNGVLVAFNNATQQFMAMTPTSLSNNMPYTAQDPSVSPYNMLYGPAGYNYAYLNTKNPNNPIISMLNGSPAQDSQGDPYIADGVQWYNVMVRASARAQSL